MTSKVAQKLLLPFENVPKYGCFICGMQFYAHETRMYDLHVVKCSDENEDIVMESMSTRHKMKDILAVGDPELEAFVAEHRKDYISGKMKL
jgi:hypothetical protein